MEILHKPLFLVLIFFIVFFNLITFGHSRATLLAHHDPKRVDSHDHDVITIADLTPVERHHDPSGHFHGAEMDKDDQKRDTFSSGLPQGSYGDSYGYGYQNPYPGGIFGFPRGFFGFPRGLFGFPRGLFGFPRGIFGFPGGIFGFPVGFGGNPGGYDGYLGRYGGYPSGYDDRRDVDKPSGGGGGYGGKAEVKAK